VSPDPVLEGLDDLVVPLSDEGDRHDALLDLIGERRVVLLGEASHGSAEFYRERAHLTRRLETYLRNETEILFD
jgi:erythromycin esterase-like protein